VRRLVVLVMRRLIEPVGRRKTKMNGKGEAIEEKGKEKPIEETDNNQKKKTRETRGNRTY
jgi:Na+/citrate or Na+/malate symporter